MSSPYPVEPLVGNDCGLFYNSATYSAPTWVEIDEAGEVSLADWNVSEAEIVTRAADWAVAMAAKFRAAIEFQYLWGANWTVLTWLRTAFMARTRLDVIFMDFQDLTSTEPYAQGLRMPVQIRNFPINQPNEEVAKVDTCRMTPCYATDAPGGNRISPVWVYSDGAGGIGVDPPATVLIAAQGKNDPPVGTTDVFGTPRLDPALLKMLQDSGKTQTYPIMAAVEAGRLKGTPHEVRVHPVPDDFIVYAPARVVADAGGEVPDNIMAELARVEARDKKAPKAKAKS